MAPADKSGDDFFNGCRLALDHLFHIGPDFVQQL
jgi:hypothetical protein